MHVPLCPRDDKVLYSLHAVTKGRKAFGIFEEVVGYVILSSFIVYHIMWFDLFTPSNYQGYQDSEDGP